MEQQEYDELLRRLAASAERHEAQMALANERLGKAEETLTRMTHQLDRTDRTHAGISLTLQRLTSTLEEQTGVLRDLRTTLDRWVDRFGNGRTEG